MRIAPLLLVMLATLAVGHQAHAARIGRPAPDFGEGGQWLNTGGRPLALAALRGKVVAVEIWTAGCYNCLNVLPSLRQWDARYRAQGLVIVGVHTPEFRHEHSEQYVRDRVGSLGIKYPVVMDNGFKIWRAYNNIYWPTIYLVDKKGIIRYSHAGEGNYRVTEATIRQLLAEAP